MLVTRGKCDAEGCEKLFEIEGGGFAITINDDQQEVGVLISRIDSAAHAVVCGKECLMKVILAACDKTLGVTMGGGNATRIDVQETTAG